MKTTHTPVNEQALRLAVKHLDPSRAQEIREAYYQVVTNLQVLAEVLEVADLDTPDNLNHPLLEEHLIAVRAMETMHESQLGRIL